MKPLTYPFELGDFQCFAINDASRAHTAGNLVANADGAPSEISSLQKWPISGKLGADQT